MQRSTIHGRRCWCGWCKRQLDGRKKRERGGVFYVWQIPFELCTKGPYKIILKVLLYDMINGEGETNIRAALDVIRETCPFGIEVGTLHEGDLLIGSALG